MKRTQGKAARKGRDGRMVGIAPLLAALTATSLALFCFQAGAKQSMRQITIGATVQPYAQDAAGQPTQLVITNKDVNLGYLNVPDGDNPSGSTLTVKTNDRAGYTLVFQVAPSEQALLSSIQVYGLGTSVTLPATGGTVTMPFTGSTINLSLTYRFNLAKKLKDGTYAWPLTIIVRPN
ncbi:hypothetical protein [Trinickia sp. EG282A]|uniref:hypothetical protein n=1 Tax=Trinickia sp. EG282A TaxID=3237013 RepID=UPI0034D21B77